MNPMLMDEKSDPIHVAHPDSSPLPHSHWTLLNLPGLPLRNSLNKCWFHAGLHLLTAIPPLRTLSLSPPRGIRTFERRFLAAIHAIFVTRRPTVVDCFFSMVRDFTGVNNRYGQVAVPDFIEHLCANSPNVSPVVKFTFSSKLTCSKCHWVSEQVYNDVSLKLHLPPGCTYASLSDLVNFNSNAVLAGNDAVFCGNCRTKTSQIVSRYYNPDMFIMEVVRVTEHSRNNWVKNNAPLSFDLKDLNLSGFNRRYNVVGTCHHRGSLDGGHWFTKVLTSKGWFEMDDLKRNCLQATPPGVNDDSVTIILAIAEDKLRF